MRLPAIWWRSPAIEAIFKMTPDPCFSIRGKHVLAAQESGLQIEIHLGVPNFFAHGGGIARSRTADVIHQYIHAAEAFDASLHSRADFRSRSAYCSDKLRKFRLPSG